MTEPENLEALFSETDQRDRRSEFLAMLDELGISISDLAMRMQQKGDFRTQAAIKRSLQRVIALETNVSAELFIVVNMLLQKERRYKLLNQSIQWSRQNDAVCATIRGFNISMYHWKSKSWQIHVVSKESGYSHPYPSYPTTLEAAQLKALECVEDAELVLAQYRLNEAERATKPI